MELSNGTFLHREKYQILSKISRGNFGITYKAEQTSLDRQVCIKEFFFRGFCERSSDGSITISSSGQEMANSFRRKFIREAKRLSQFDHPNIVKVIDVFEENGTAYMVMDYIDGETLQQLVDRKGEFSESEALQYIIPLCNALEVVHDKGLLHLDIKPSNILIKKHTNIPVLIDFGISKFTEASAEDHSTTTPVALTKGYAPLEQYGQDLAKLTVATDVYSVAATLYKMVTGVTPPEATVIVQDGIKPPKEINPTLSEQLNSIVLQSLSVKPNHRALSISKLKADLKGISKLAIIPDTEGDTEVIGERKRPEPKSPKPNAPIEKRNYAALWSILALVALFALIVLADGFNTAPDSSNEVRKTDTPVTNAESKYDFVSDYTEGLARVRKGDKWGFIDANNRETIPLIYDDVTVFSNDKASVKFYGRWLEIDKNGYEIKNVVNSNQSISDNNARQVATSGQTIFYENPVTDIDGNVYKTVKIDNQVWMASNLKTTKYNDGTTIPLVTDNSTWNDLITPGYCWYNNDAIANKSIYGALYNWYTVKTGMLCPTGWHVPTDLEWMALTNYLEGWSVSGGKLKETGTSHWRSPNTAATNEMSFAAVPGGARGDSGGFGNLGDFGFWWSSSEYSTTNAWYRNMGYDYSDVVRLNYNKLYGFSVRCLRDY
jgi:uncharacterized protein (TIGR02145 family)